MKIITIDEIKTWKPCYPPEDKLPKDWSGTALDILNRTDISFEDRLWVLMRSDILSDKLMRLFAVWCARQVQHLMVDQRSIDAICVAERFANGNATTEELAAARAATWAAAIDVALSTVRDDAAWDAAENAAENAAWAAAEAVVRDATMAAAWDAAWAATWDAAMAVMVAENTAEDATRDATRDAVMAATRDAQEVQLRKMILDGIKTGDTL